MNKEKEKSADDDGVVFPFYPRQLEGGSAKQTNLI